MHNYSPETAFISLFNLLRLADLGKTNEVHLSLLSQVLPEVVNQVRWLSLIYKNES